MVVPGHDGIEKVIGAAEAAGGDAAADGVERRPQEEQPRETENVPLEKVPELKPFAREHQQSRQHEKDGDTAAYGGTDEAERNKGGFIQRAAVIERRAGMDNDNHYAGRYSA